MLVAEEQHLVLDQRLVELGPRAGVAGLAQVDAVDLGADRRGDGSDVEHGALLDSVRCLTLSARRLHLPGRGRPPGFRWERKGAGGRPAHGRWPRVVMLRLIYPTGPAAMHDQPRNIVPHAHHRAGGGVRWAGAHEPLSEEFGDDLEIVLIDRGDGFVFGFSKLDVMFGRRRPAAVVHPYRDLVKPGVRFVQTDGPVDRPGGRSGSRPTPATFEADILVVALGADLRPGGHARAGRGRPRVLHGRRGLRAARRAGRLRRWAGDRRRHVDAVQVPTRAQRDGPAHARLPHRPGRRATARRSRSSCRWACPSRRRRRRRRRCSPRSPSGASSGIPDRLVRELDPATQGRRARRRQRDAVRPVPRRARCTGRRPSWRSRG